LAQGEKETDVQKKARQEERVRNKKRLESCLTLVRSLYTKKEVIKYTTLILTIERSIRFCDKPPQPS